MLSRRELLLGFLAGLLAPRPAHADPVARLTPYHANVGVLYGLFTFRLDGMLDEHVDRTAGTYRVHLAGEGAGIVNRFESSGLVDKGRFVPTVSAVYFSVRGRQNETRISYDFDRGLIHYRHRSETFLLGRVREGANTLPLPPGDRFDDFVSVILNYTARVFDDGPNRTLVVRRARREGEGVDDVQAEGYRGEIVPLTFSVAPDRASGTAVAAVDFSVFSSWARASDPARLVFGVDRRIEKIDVPLMLGTTIKIAFQNRA